MALTFPAFGRGETNLERITLSSQTFDGVWYRSECELRGAIGRPLRIVAVAEGEELDRRARWDR